MSACSDVLVRKRKSRRTLSNTTDYPALFNTAWGNLVKYANPEDGRLTYGRARVTQCVLDAMRTVYGDGLYNDYKSFLESMVGTVTSKAKKYNRDRMDASQAKSASSSACKD